jgi:hypothetical protein
MDRHRPPASAVAVALDQELVAIELGLAIVPICAELQIGCGARVAGDTVQQERARQDLQ